MATRSTVSGGEYNTASGNYSAVLGGRCNNTNGYKHSMIVGSNISANRAGTTFVNKLSAMNFDECATVGSLPSGSFYYDSATCLVMFKP